MTLPLESSRNFLALCLTLLLFSSASPAAEPAPQTFKWETPAPPARLAASNPQIKAGGKIRLFLPSFPLTLRQVGPDSNQAFRNYLDENDMSLVNRHPNSDAWMPELATHWAFDAKEPRLVYFKLDPKAQWSDGKPVKASDYVYTLSFMRSPFIKAPWYNDYYSRTIDSVRALSDPSGGEILEVKLREANPDPLYYANLKPTPEHFYGQLGENWVSTFNWKIPPSTGPYELVSFTKGKDLSFRRKKNWWAREKEYFQQRFNIDEVQFKVIRDAQMALEYLKLGEIDALTLTNPELWYASEKSEPFVKGYIRRLQAYNEVPRSDYVLILNNSYEPFRSPEVRQAFGHAMNIERVIQELMRGDFKRLQGISQGYGPYTDPTIKARAFDLKAADSLLDKAGWTARNGEGIRMKDGKPLAATILYSPPTLTARLVLLREDARKAGIDLKLEQGDDASVFKSYLDKRHEIAVMNWGTAFRPEYRARFHSQNANKPQSSNFSNTADARLDQLIEEYEHAGEQKLRIAKAHAIQQFVHADASQIPLFEVPYYRLAYWSWIQFPRPSGAKTTDSLYLFDTGSGGLVWIDPEREKAAREARKLGKSLNDPENEKTWIDETFKQK